jgi:hypothetical protein
MGYWSRPVLVGRREWRLVNVSGKPLTVESRQIVRWGI